MKQKAVAVKAAKEAGKIMLHYYRNKVSVSHKSKTELLTEADVLCERKIKSILIGKFPAHNFLGEESGESPGDSEYTWVVDPIDGTNNFAHKYPRFCTSIALVKDNKPVMGVVYNPLSRELFYAGKGKGAFLNSKKITVSKTKRLEESLIETGFPYSGTGFGEKSVRNIGNIIGKVVGIRRGGAAAYEMCLVAQGALDAFFCYTLKPWDVAAAKLMVEEAGGKVTGFNGKPCDIFSQHLVASNGLVCNRLLKLLEEP